MKFILLWPVLLLPACVPLPVPHSTVNSWRYSGRIIDAKTNRPVPDAKVVLNGLDDSRTRTDANGTFTTRVSRSWHLAGLYTYDDGMRLQFPPSRSTDGKLLVSHSGYQPAVIKVGNSVYPNAFQGSNRVEVEPVPEIRLRPLGR